LDSRSSPQESAALHPNLSQQQKLQSKGKKMKNGQLQITQLKAKNINSPY